MPSHVLTLREYESARIGETWDPVRRIVPGWFVSAVERHQRETGQDVFQCGRRALSAGNWVGTFSYRGKSIDVLPKVDEADNAVVRGNLVRMLLWARMVPARQVGLIEAISNVHSLLDLFMLLYVERMLVEWKAGAVRSYHRLDDDRLALKGKLLLPQHLRRNQLRPERFFTRADVYSADVPLSQALKAAVRLCEQFCMLTRARRCCADLLPIMDGVGDRRFTPDELGNIEADRRYRRFEPLLNLAKFLLSRCTPGSGAGGQTYNLMFDMNVVFEKFIGELLRRVVCPPDLNARLQLGGRCLVIREGRQRFRLRPDVGVFRRRNLLCLIDTKWKRLDLVKPNEDVKQADIYQAYAYGKEFQSPLVVLLYPRFGDISDRLASYRHPPAATDSPRIEICSVDVSKVPVGREETTVASQLRSLFDAWGIHDTAQTTAVPT